MEKGRGGGCVGSVQLWLWSRHCRVDLLCGVCPHCVPLSPSSLPPSLPPPSPHQVLQGLHSEKRAVGVDAMLQRLYEPVLYRAFDANNAAMRLNALHLMLAAFPIMVRAGGGGEGGHLMPTTPPHLCGGRGMRGGGPVGGAGQPQWAAGPCDCIDASSVNKTSHRTHCTTLAVSLYCLSCTAGPRCRPRGDGGDSDTPV